MTQLSEKQKLHQYQKGEGEITPFESKKILAISAFLLQDM